MVCKGKTTVGEVSDRRLHSEQLEELLPDLFQQRIVPPPRMREGDRHVAGDPPAGHHQHPVGEHGRLVDVVRRIVRKAVPIDFKARPRYAIGGPKASWLGHVFGEKPWSTVNERRRKRRYRSGAGFELLARAPAADPGRGGKLVALVPVEDLEAMALALQLGEPTLGLEKAIERNQGLAHLIGRWRVRLGRRGDDRRDPWQQLVRDEATLLEVEPFELPEKLVDLTDEQVRPNLVGVAARLDSHGLPDVDVGLLEHPNPFPARWSPPGWPQVCVNG